MSAAFKDLDSAFCDHAKANNLQDGTTCVLAVIKSNEITVASLGDSICIKVPKSGASTRLSVSHKADRNDERNRILSKGGNILWQNRVEGEIEVTRAFGNLSHKKLIISEPETS